MPLKESDIKAFAIFLGHVDDDDDTIAAALIDEGIDEAMIDKLIQFIPLALCRVFLRSTGIVFADHYRVRDPDGRGSEEILFDDDPVYCAVMAVAEAQVASGSERHLLRAVAARSAEDRLIHALFQSGQRPEDIVLSAPYVLGLTSSPGQPGKGRRSQRKK